ncbi:MAG: DEAD/DEAH box helicase family protein [Microthrixaceae bacterium]
MKLRTLAALEDQLAILDQLKDDRKDQIKASAALGVADGTALTSQEIEEIQEEIRRISDQRKAIWADVKDLRDDRTVARHAGRRGDKTSDDLRAEADALLRVEDRNLIAPLIDLHSSWIEQLGLGAELHEALLLSTQVVAATCIGLSSFDGADRASFDLCIVDEASKATATETLVPLVRSKKWILVGDDKQLPPFQDEALRARNIIDEFSLDEAELHRSLFSRMSDGLPRANSLQLSVQYRMVDAIGDLISRCFYNGKVNNAGISSPKWTNGLQAAPVTWFDTHLLRDHADHRRKGERSFSNQCEVKQVVAHLKRLDFMLSRQRLDDVHISVLILAPYAAQVLALQRAISTIHFSTSGLSVEVNTVDASQGREADVLIFSATRSNESFEIGFVRDLARSNVALSRGRYLLAIFGDTPFFDGASGPLTDVIRHIRTNPGNCHIEELVQ